MTTENKITVVTDLSVVTKLIGEIKATAGAHRHTINQALIGAIYQANVNGNADAMIKLQQALMADSPRELNVFNKALNKFAAVSVNVDSTKVGKFETKIVKGMLGDEKLVKSRKENFNKWLETGMVDIKNPAWESKETTPDAKKIISVEFRDLFAFADYASGKDKDPVVKSMAERQKALIAQMCKNKNLTAFEFLDGFIRNVGIDATKIAPEQRINKEQAAILIDLLNKFSK